VDFDEVHYVGLQLPDCCMDAALQLFAREFSKPALYLIDPRCGCWCEMHIIMWAPRQPGLDLFCFVGGVVIHDDVDYGNAHQPLAVCLGFTDRLDLTGDCLNAFVKPMLVFVEADNKIVHAR
jgi:hypothetical protein